MSNGYGRALEDGLDWTHRQYESIGRAIVYHNKTVGKYVAPGVFVPEKSRPDYTGIIPPDGRMFAFDAKSTGNINRWKIRTNRIHQYEELLRLDRFGVITFFLIEAREIHKIFLLRIRHTKPIRDGRPYILFDHYQNFEVIVIPYKDGSPPKYIGPLLDDKIFCRRSMR